MTGFSFNSLIIRSSFLFRYSDWVLDLDRKNRRERAIAGDRNVIK